MVEVITNQYVLGKRQGNKVGITQQRSKWICENENLNDMKVFYYNSTTKNLFIYKIILLQLKIYSSINYKVQHSKLTRSIGNQYVT